MKAFLLAAGRGTRLRPLTDDIPKCLLPIRGSPILRIWLDLCRRHGIDEVLVNAHSHVHAVRRFLSQNGHGLKVQISEEPTLLGSAGTLLANRDWVASEPCFWILYADVLTAADLTDMLRFHRNHHQPVTIGVYEVPDPSRCGIVKVDERSIVREFIEKPAVPSSNLAFAGLLLASRDLLNLLPQELPADIGFDVLPQLVGRMAAYRVREYLIDIGTPQNYAAVQLNWPGAELSRNDA